MQQNKPSAFRAWVEAMRLRTLPVSVAGVIAGGACARLSGGFRLLPFLVCLIFAAMAQVVSNFANEYFDFKKGLDSKGREGFRRGVTEGDISPRAMRNATFGLLAATCAVGLTLLIWGPWWLICIGILIAVFALAYSAGPWPLSSHGLGDLAVIVFFGLVPVSLTAWIEAGDLLLFWPTSAISVAIGLMAANVLVVNNYRDADDDRKVGKRTTVVIFGRKAASNFYCFNGFCGAILIAGATITLLPPLWLLGPLVYVNLHWLLWQKMRNISGKELNPLLGKTAMLLLGISVWLVAAAFLAR